LATNRVSANRAYQILKGKVDVRLTEQQVRATEDASVDWPSLVVAGAGSGKTELMATRVVWLIANEVCKPEEILGLTFTRKAASELSTRIVNAITKLAQTSEWPYESKDFALPNITTYNSYANSLYRDYALGLGFDDEALLLTEAGRFQLAREVVIEMGEEVGNELIDADISLNSLVKAILAISGSMTDHGVSAEAISNYINGLLQSIAELPAKGAVSKENPIYATLAKTLAGMKQTPLVAKLAELFIDVKRKRGYIDYADQVALAELAIRELGHLVVERENQRYKQILLDEYQDTSTLQTSLLHGLFHEKSVYAVGDPNQSIYGWRGASSSNLADFLQGFGTEDKPVQQFPLTNSWRNPRVVLDVANEVIRPLALKPKFMAGRPELPKVAVETLQPAPRAEDGAITVNFAHDVFEEATYTAKWFSARMEQNPKATAAVLMRSRNSMEIFEEELRREGLVVEVVGIGGLLSQPEIVDLISALHVIYRPDSGAHLLRILAGPRWQVVPKDLERLSSHAKSLAKFSGTNASRVSGGDADASIIDALDRLLDEVDEDIPSFTVRGFNALKDCGNLLRQLRSKTGLPLPEFVRAVEQELWLDIELTANPARQNPLQYLNEFAELVSNYAEVSKPTLGGLLDWLEYADSLERFEPKAKPGRPGVVQIITAHSAKGLEWDLVAIPRLIDKTFPSTSKSVGWLSRGELPYGLRGDANSLPQLDISGCLNQTEVNKMVDSYKKDMIMEHQLLEERRVFYVAVTRPRSELLLSGSFWSHKGKTASKPSEFLVEVAKIIDDRIFVENFSGDPEAPLPSYDDSLGNPFESSAVVQTWPMDPLGPGHRAKVNRAKQLMDSVDVQTAPKTSAIDEEIERLIAEREELATRTWQVRFPVRISASRFKEYVKELPKVAESFRRPMPEKPYKQTREGTLFHGWVEKRFGKISNSDEIDTIDAEFEDEETTATVEELQEIFEKSRFASMTSHSIESEIQVTIRENTFICKLDAVFETETGYEIVDWKTGVPPKTEQEIEERALQLALYRMAFSRLHNVSAEKVEVCLYYVAENLEIKPQIIPSEPELLELWDSVLAQVVD